MKLNVLLYLALLTSGTVTGALMSRSYVATAAPASAAASAQTGAKAFVVGIQQGVVQLKLEITDSGTQRVYSKGTGYFIHPLHSDELLVLTCLHCVDDYLIIRHRYDVSGEDGSVKLRLYYYPHHTRTSSYVLAEDVVYLDQTSDLALLSISAERALPTSQVTALPIGSLGDTGDNTSVVAVGFPAGELTVFPTTMRSSTIVRDRYWVDTEGAVLASVPPNAGGISGSPLVSEHGVVVGTWYGSQGSEGFCISLWSMRWFLRSYFYASLFRRPRR